MSNEDIGKEIIDFECEHCKRIIKVTLSQIAREDTVKCVCGSDIKLLDENGSFKKAIKDINSAFRKNGYFMVPRRFLPKHFWLVYKPLQNNSFNSFFEKQTSRQN